jgi:hypothetical protein
VGIFGFGKDSDDESDAAGGAGPGSALDTAPAKGSGAGGALVERLMDAGIDGKGRFDSAGEVAAKAVREHGTPDEAVDAIVASHLRLAAAGGFVTSLGGFVTMPVALPANVLGFYVIATRMVASIASVRGYDIRQPEVRSAVLLTLIGADSDDLLKKAGMLSSGRLASLATQRLPAPVLLAVNKGIGFRLLRQVGEKSLTRFGKGVPLVGGFVGAGVDSYMLKKIGDKARIELPVR